MDLQRISASTYPLIDRPLEEAMSILAAAGLRKIDLSGQMPHFSVHPAEWDAAFWKQRAVAYRLQVSHLETAVAGGFASDNTAEQEREWKRLCQVIDLGAFLGARSIRLFGNESPVDDPAMIARLVPWLQCGARAGELKGIHLAIESGGGLQNLHSLVEQVGSPFLGVLFTPSQFMTSGVGCKAAFDLLQHHIIHVRLKVGGLDCPQTGILNEMDIPWLLRSLDEIGYHGDISLEYEGKPTDIEAGLKEGVRFLITLP